MPVNLFLVRHERRQVMEYDLLGADFYNDPYPILAEMRRNHPCWFDHRLGAYVVTRYGDVSRILQNDDFSSRRVRQFTRGAPNHLRAMVDVYVDSLERWLLFIDPPHHTKLRARLERAFGPALLPAITVAAKEAVRDALDRIGHEGLIDAVAQFAYPVPTQVLARVFGISDDDIERFKRWTIEIFSLIGAGVADEQAVETGYRGVTELHDYVLALIDQKRRAPTDDMLSALAAPADSEADDEIGEEDLVGLFMSMIVAGHETSTNLIANALRAVMLDAAARDRVAGPVDLSEAAVDEFVRYDGPVASMLRRAKRDLVIAGTVVPEGSFLFSMLISANRDPRQFQAPDRLDLDRPLSAHVGFGVGMHRCVGPFMARVVVRQAVQAFMRRFPKSTIADGCVWHRNTSFRGLAIMPVEIGP
jgi:cytochrome P450